MGIGRREFLRLTSLALSGIVVNPLQAVVTTEHVYINKKLGILFHKPHSWKFVNVKDFGDLKDAQILGNGYEEIKDEFWEKLGYPVCLVTKYYPETDENKGLFSPTISVDITPKSALDHSNIESIQDVIAMSNYAASLYLRDFVVVKEYSSYLICGCKFYEYDAEYLFEHVDLDKPVKVELKAIKAEHNGFYYDFNCHQSKEKNEIAHEEFERFKKSIKLI